VEQNPTPPIISIIGRSGAGKTTFLTKLVTELRRRGYRVAVLKHHRPKHLTDTGQNTGDSGGTGSSHSTTESSADSSRVGFDIPGKDTWRHFQAGADTVIISGLDQMAMYHRLMHEPTPDELVRLLPGPVDIVLTEGYTSAGKPAIEILRTAQDRRPIATRARLIALVSDTGLTLDVPQFGLDDAKGVATFLERRFSLVPADPDTRQSAAH
jgi:molybdopterin-guanine dinucleotide biosynthesis adapter protein